MAHGELGPVARTRTRLHVQRCARCQKRVSDFALVSAAFASALGPTGSQRPAGVNPRPASTSPGSGIVIAGLIAIIGIALFFATRAALTLAPQQPQSTPSHSSTYMYTPPVGHTIPGCKPGILSDKCRN